MSANIKGRAVAWSIGGVTFTAGIVSATNASMPQSARLARTAEEAVIKDDGATIRAMIYHGKRKSFSVTVVPYGANIAGASTSADAHLIEPGTTITVADATGAIADGDYNLVSATENRTVDGVRMIDLELTKGDEGVDTTTLAS
jgi:hypothetical protein